MPDDANSEPSKWRIPLPKSEVVPLNAVLVLVGLFMVPLSVGLYKGTISPWVLAWLMLMITVATGFFFYVYNFFMTTNPGFLQSDAIRKVMLDNSKQGPVLELKAVPDAPLVSNTHSESAMSKTPTAIGVLKPDEPGETR